MTIKVYTAEYTNKFTCLSRKITCPCLAYIHKLLFVGCAAFIYFLCSFIITVFDHGSRATEFSRIGRERDEGRVGGKEVVKVD